MRLQEFDFMILESDRHWVVTDTCVSFAHDF